MLSVLLYPKEITRTEIDESNVANSIPRSQILWAKTEKGFLIEIVTEL